MKKKKEPTIFAFGWSSTDEAQGGGPQLGGREDEGGGTKAGPSLGAAMNGPTWHSSEISPAFPRPTPAQQQPPTRVEGKKTNTPINIYRFASS